MNYVNTAVRGTAFFGIVAVFLPWLLLRTGWTFSPWELDGLRYLGLPLIILGGGIAARCAFDFAHRGEGTPAPFDPPKKLVTTWLYQRVRNPMYVGMGLLLLGEAVWCQRLILVFYLAALALLAHGVVVYYEEPRLRAKFGQGYDEYCQKVPRWWPGCRPSQKN